MRTFTLAPALDAWLTTLVAAHPDAAVPALPPPPTDPEQLAFYNQFLVPLAEAKAAIVPMVPPPAPDPYALDASGQPVNPEMWGTSPGAP